NRNSYVAIAGAVDRLDAAGVFRERRNTDASSWSIDFGITAWGGVLVPDWSGVNIAAIAGGTSNTMVGGEQSDTPTFLSGCGANQFQMPSTGGGLFRGHQGPGRDATGNLSEAQRWMDSRGQTYTTIRYRINAKTGWKQGQAFVGVSNPRWSGEDANVPLVSAHTGGVNVLVAGGSVSVLAGGAALLVLVPGVAPGGGGV